LSLVACGASNRTHPISAPLATALHHASLTPAEIAERSLPSVVAVKSDKGFGTGFVVKKEGWIATNFHVVRGARALSVLVPERGEFPVIEMLVLDEKVDLAVLRIDEKDLPVLALGDSTSVRSGDPVVAIGHPLGYDNTVSNGLVSAIREAGTLTVFQI